MAKKKRSPKPTKKPAPDAAAQELAGRIETECRKGKLAQARHSLQELTDALGLDEESQTLRARCERHLIAGYANSGQLRRSWEVFHAGSSVEGPGALDEWLQAGASLIAANGKDGRIDSAVEVVECIEQRSPDTGQDRLALRMGEVYLAALRVLGRAGRIDEARAVHAKVEGLSEAAPEEIALEHQRATATFLLAASAGRAGQPGTARAIVDELEAVCARHPEDMFLREQHASALYNLGNDYAKQAQMEPAHRAYDELADLAQRYPDELRPLELQAMASVNLIAAYGLARRAPSGREVFARLDERVGDGPDHAGLRDLWARAVINLVDAFDKAGQSPAVLDVLRGLVERAGRHPDAEVLAGAVAQARTRWGRLLDAA